MMQVARTFDEMSLTGPALLTIGTFDGVHRGHRFLLEQAQQRCIEHGYGLVIVTFDPCPAVVLRPSLTRYQLTSARQKLRQLEELSPALVALLQFTPQLAALSADEFMQRLEGALQLREMWLGEDFGFGRDRSGNLGLLVERGRRAGFALHVVSRRMDGADSISSSRVRQTLREGDVEGAIPLLGRPFALDLAAGLRDPGRSAAGSTVVEYVMPPYLSVPADGVYAGFYRNGAGDEVPTAVAVETVDAGSMVRLWAPVVAPIDTIEFIARLPQSTLELEAWPALHRQAIRRLEGWHRPSYPATGSY